MIDAQIRQPLQNVHIGLAGRDNAKTRVGPARHRHSVKPVRPGIGLYGSHFLGMKPGFLGKPIIITTDIQPAFRWFEIIRQMAVEIVGG